MKAHDYLRHTLRLVLPVLLSLCLSPALPVCAQAQSISQMVHMSWTGRDGAPQAINIFAQTPDGILWMGGLGGLYSFDGLAFQNFRPGPNSPPLPMKMVRFLFVSRDGDLWVFGFQGPPARIHQEQVTIYDRVEGGSINVLGNAHQDSKGTIWAILNGRCLVTLGQDGVWHPRSNPKKNIGHISQQLIDSADTQWVIEDNLLYRRATEQSNFQATDIHVDGPAKLVESADHKLWIMGQGPNVRTGPDRASSVQFADLQGHRLYTPPAPEKVFDILPEPDGSLWISNSDQGLRHLKAWEIDKSFHHGVGAPDVYGVKDGLASGAKPVMFRDSDGNIWVGGTAGVDRFHHAKLVAAIPGSPAGWWSTCVTSDDAVWAVNQQGKNFVLANGRTVEVDGLRGVSTIYCGKYGDVWAMDTSGVADIRAGRIHRLPLLPGYKGYTDHYVFEGVFELGRNSLLASVGGATGSSLWRYKNGKWDFFLPQHKFPEVTAIYQQSDGTLLLGHRYYEHGTDNITIIKNEIPKQVTTGSPGLGTVAGFYETDCGLFAYGENGIAIDRGDRFQLLSLAEPDYGRTLTGMIQSRNGDFWLNGYRGILHIPRSEVLASLTDHDHAIVAENLQEGNFIGPDAFGAFMESAQVDSTGRLWFSTLNGVLWVDASSIDQPSQQPKVSIRAISADGVPLDANGSFPPSIQTLDIRYFGVNLTNPKKVVYRYRLDNFDSAWQDVGNRTDAIYTHLRAGSYRFQVMASNGNDIWTKPVSSTLFRIRPHFYERAWMQALFALGCLLLAWVAISLRVRYVSAAIRIRAEERADERIRIARELHDTLLQGVQGMLLTFHVAAQKVPADHESKPALERALTTADHIIVEGRNRVNRLRSENLTDAELKSLIEGVAESLRSIEAIEFALERKGGSDTLKSHVVDEVFCIAREAITNAYRHSAASWIAVELDYQKREFRLTCCDNGRGFDSKEFLANETNGHWGLRGMTERAERIGADFFCDSSVNGGTKVCVVVPARRAYQRQGRFRIFR
jgi:signal transduction histidine kinase/ligand-binding sensor domain-containing protein